MSKKLDNIITADTRLNLEDTEVINSLTPDEIDNITLKNNIINTYNIKESDITPEFITKYGSDSMRKLYKNRMKIKQHGVSHFKKEIINSYSKHNSEYASLDKAFKDTRCINIIAALDILKIMLNSDTNIEKLIHFSGKNTIKDFGLSKSEFQNRLDKVCKLIENDFSDAFKFKRKMQLSKNVHKIKVLNSIISEAIDVKFVVASNNSKYKPVVVGYNST